MRDSVDSLSQVTQRAAASAEEQSSTAAEQAGQAEQLTSLVQQFTLEAPLEIFTPRR